MELEASRGWPIKKKDDALVILEYRRDGPQVFRLVPWKRVDHAGRVLEIGLIELLPSEKPAAAPISTQQ